MSPKTSVTLMQTGKRCCVPAMLNSCDLVAGDIKLEGDFLHQKMNKYEGRRFLHICEVCGKRAILGPEEAYAEGWDYPPMMYDFKVVSPRTCDTCSITETAWWQMAVLLCRIDVVE